MAGALVESGEVGAAELGVSCVLVGWPVPTDALRTCCSIETCSNGMNAGDQEGGSRDDRGEGEARHGVRQRRCTAVEGREPNPKRAWRYRVVCTSEGVQPQNATRGSVRARVQADELLIGMRERVRERLCSRTSDQVSLMQEIRGRLAVLIVCADQVE